MKRFLENKDHLIDKLTSLTDAQKEEIKAFFAKHPSYESKIDWNNKSLSYKDFEPILALEGKSRTQARKKGIEGLIEGKDYRYLGSGYNSEIGNYTLYQPLTYLGSKTLASNKVPPVRGNGAKWCIAYQKTSEYWNDYTSRGIAFAFVLTEDTKYAITIYPENLDKDPEVYSFEDVNLRAPEWLTEGEDSVIDNIDLTDLLITTADTLEKKLLADYVKRGIFIKNEDGSYSKEGPRDVDLTLYNGLFVRNGKLTVRFRKWRGYFLIKGKGLTTLEGCPEEIEGGGFDCTGNKLTSLKYAPKKVDGSFYCSENKLTTLRDFHGIINGGFHCDRNQLTDLEGAPEVVNGHFVCSHNRLTSLKGAPKKVTRSFDCSDNKLTSLEGVPEGVQGIYAQNNKIAFLRGLPEELEADFNCSGNKLRTLQGAPKRIWGSFSCDHNQLVNLEGGPEAVGINYSCVGNKLTTLKGAPKSIPGYFDCRDNNLTSLEGAPEEVYNLLDCGGNPLKSLDGSLKMTRKLRYSYNHESHASFWDPVYYPKETEDATRKILEIARKM